MFNEVGMGELDERIEQYERMSLAGIDESQEVDLGPLMFLWRRFRDGRETWEALPAYLAELTIGAIPTNEPNVERAKLCKEMPIEHHI